MSADWDALSGRLAAEPGVEEGIMFHNPGLKVDGKLFAFLREGDLVVKLTADRCAALIEAGEAERMQIGKRALREWVSVADPGADAGWEALAREARDFVRATARASGASSRRRS